MLKDENENEIGSDEEDEYGEKKIKKELPQELTIIKNSINVERIANSSQIEEMENYVPFNESKK